MDIETLNERKKILNVQLQNAQNKMIQAQNDVIAIDGALQEIDYLINLFNSTKEKESEGE